VPVAPTAIEHPQPVTTLLAPARPLPSAPEQPKSHRPQTGDAQAPIANTFFQSAAVEIRGVIGSTATVGGNAAHIAAPGIHGMATQAGQYNEQAALQAIASSNSGKNVDRRA
jgi:hypothetical protein